MKCSIDDIQAPESRAPYRHPIKENLGLNDGQW